jgi:DNA-binding MurR/RpiR family transcriptional regulator
MSDPPDYYTTASLAEAAGVSMATFHRHCRQNVGGVKDARLKLDAMGIRYVARLNQRHNE